MIANSAFGDHRLAINVEEVSVQKFRCPPFSNGPARNWTPPIRGLWETGLFHFPQPMIITVFVKNCVQKLGAIENTRECGCVAGALPTTPQGPAPGWGQDALAGVESGEVRNVGETVLLLASQLEERDTTLAQLKVWPGRVCGLGGRYNRNGRQQRPSVV